MALNQSLDMKEDDTAFLTSDESVVMSMINPNFKSKQDKYLDAQFNANQDSFARSAKDDTLLLQGDPNESNPFARKNTQTGLGSGEEQSGGFAVAALLPLIPIIAPLIKPAIEALIGLFRRKKGNGSVNPPNAQRYGYGSVNPPNGGLDIMGYLQDRLPVLQQKEEQLKDLPGDQFWSAVPKIMQQEIGNLVKLLQQDGFNIPNPQRIVNAVIARTLPKSFLARVGRGRKSGAGSTGSQLGTIIKPMVKWSVYKSLDNKTSPQERKAITHGLSNIDTLITPEDAKGGRLTWEKIRATAKNVIARLLPKVAPILKQVAQQMIDRIPNMVEVMLDRAGIESEGVREVVGKAAQTVGQEVSNEAFDRLQGVASRGSGEAGSVHAEREPRGRGGKGGKSTSKKGSAEMRDRMAKLRAMRGTKGKSRTTKKASGGSKKTPAYEIKLL
jgi:hypothetical protein